MANDHEFQSIYKEYHPKIHQYMIKLVGNEEAEDLTQDVFIKIQKGLKNFRGDSKFSTWIYKIATNTALDKLRSPNSKRIIRQKQIIEEDEEINIEPEAQDTWSGEKPLSTEQSYVKEEMNTCIHNHIEDLPPDFKAVILLSEMEGLKNKEIAEVLGVTLETVKIRLHRGRSILKMDLDSNCNFYRNERNKLSCDKK
ncbi:RNA polymerase sigma factor [Bacteroidota bacterium]